jgi:hypothetical protein
MRSSKSLFLAGCLMVLAMALIGLSCSGDDTTTTPVVPEDPEVDNGIEARLEEVSSRANAHLDSILTVFESGLEVATFIDAGTGDIGNVFMGGVLPDSVKDENHWIVSWSTDLQAGLATRNIVDSLTYMVAGALSSSAKDATEMYVKHHYSYVGSDTTVSSVNVSNTADFAITGIDGSTATINGNYTSVINDKEVTADGTTWNDWTIVATASNVAVPKDGSSWTSGCPASGTITVSIEHRMAEDLDVPITTDWTLTATFTDGQAVVAVVTGQLATAYQNSFCTP